jgi:hypothetical protein
MINCYILLQNITIYHDGMKILYEIEQKILHHKILLYIAPHFQINGITKIMELE